MGCPYCSDDSPSFVVGALMEYSQSTMALMQRSVISITPFMESVEYFKGVCLAPMGLGVWAFGCWV